MRPLRDLLESGTLARGQGAFNVVGGLWPLVSMRSFEFVFGPKQDDWLVRTVGGLMISAGLVQLRAADSSAEANRLARQLGMGIAATFLTTELVYVPAGRIRWTYLADAVMEAGWIAAWALSGSRKPGLVRPHGPIECR